MSHECPYCGKELREQRSTDGTKGELQRRIRFLEAQLLEATLSRPLCSQDAFAAHVGGRVREEVAKEKAKWEVRWALREAEWRRKMQVCVDGSRAGDQHIVNMMARGENLLCVVPASMEEDPGYASFLKMAQRGRRDGKYLVTGR